MKQGDLVKYIPESHDVTGVLYGIVIKYCNIMGYFTVAWNDGTYDEDLVHSELELVNESR